MSEQEKVYKTECYCCKKIKETSPICVSASIAGLIKDSDGDFRNVCKDCNHIGE